MTRANRHGFVLTEPREHIVPNDSCPLSLLRRAAEGTPAKQTIVQNSRRSHSIDPHTTFDTKTRQSVPPSQPSSPLPTLRSPVVVFIQPSATTTHSPSPSSSLNAAVIDHLMVCSGPHVSVASSYEEDSFFVP